VYLSAKRKSGGWAVCGWQTIHSNRESCRTPFKAFYVGLFPKQGISTASRSGFGGMPAECVDDGLPGGMFVGQHQRMQRTGGIGIQIVRHTVGILLKAREGRIRQAARQCEDKRFRLSTQSRSYVPFLPCCPVVRTG
jgi:hypothetical protein